MPPETVIADITATASESSKQQTSAAGAAAIGTDAADVSDTPAAESVSTADVEQQLTDISLSQDLDDGSGAAEAVATSLPADSADLGQLG